MPNLKLDSERTRVEPCEVLIPANVPIRIGTYTFGLTEPIWVTANYDLVELLKLSLLEPDMPKPVLITRPLTKGT